MATSIDSYPASLAIDYVKKHDRGTTLFRLIYAIPAVVIVSLLDGSITSMNNSDQQIPAGAGIVTGIFVATALMILFRQRYPRWWFDFMLELYKFGARVGAYAFLLTDLYPSTTEKQAVNLNVEYPNVEKDLNKWMPLVKWLLAFPHYLALFALTIGVVIATIAAWFSILLTGEYPKSIHDFVVGVGRWHLRVYAYAFMLVTDEYPPFSLD